MVDTSPGWGLWPWHSLLKPWCGSLACWGAGKAQLIVSEGCCSFSPRCFFHNTPTSPLHLLILVGGRFVALTCSQPSATSLGTEIPPFKSLSSKQPYIIIYLFHKETGRWRILCCSLALPANSCSFYNLLIFFFPFLTLTHRNTHKATPQHHELQLPAMPARRALVLAPPHCLGLPRHLLGRISPQKALIALGLATRGI